MAKYTTFVALLFCLLLIAATNSHSSIYILKNSAAEVNSLPLYDLYHSTTLPSKQNHVDPNANPKGDEKQKIKDLDPRIALVGPNGAGKSTLLKLMKGDLLPTDGMVKRHNHLKIAQYYQHLAEKLDMDMSALQYMMREYPGNEEEEMRAAIGRFSLTGKAQVMAMKNLSDGQRRRVIFVWLAYRQPHMLLLDEPTNHLDIETIDSLAEALNEWNGGMVLVSHDFRLINQVAHEIWICENQVVTRREGDIMDFKKHLKKRAGLRG
uniref:ABC transporter F family member 1-like n=1 Tax=Nicotiana tabacum TaxID=4097 RepID=A0A1S4AFC1_TOBAC|nr:PREDICTED: ABC transporter F family member 1-like [Nicotiana tabacum]